MKLPSWFKWIALFLVVISVGTICLHHHFGHEETADCSLCLLIQSILILFIALKVFLGVLNQKPRFLFSRSVPFHPTDYFLRSFNKAPPVLS